MYFLHKADSQTVKETKCVDQSPAPAAACCRINIRKHLAATNRTIFNLMLNHERVYPRSIPGEKGTRRC